MNKPVKDESVYLAHIGECLTRIATYTQEGREAFLTDTRTQDAVVRNLQTMVESTQRLPASLKAAHPAVEWRAIAGMRNVLAHDYLDVDLDQVWEIVTSDLPPFALEIAAMLHETPAGQDAAQ